MNIVDQIVTDTVQLSGDAVVLRWLVTEDLLQLHGILHGGISAAMAENAASLGANLAANTMGRISVGLSLTTTHLNPARAGDLIETRAHPVRQGSTIQVWAVEQSIVGGRLINTSQMTMCNIKAR